jgi:hypothetical protein
MTGWLNWVGLGISLALTVYSWTLSREIMPQVPALFSTADESRALADQAANGYRGLALAASGMSLGLAQPRDEGLRLLTQAGDDQLALLAGTLQHKISEPRYEISRGDLAVLASAVETRLVSGAGSATIASVLRASSGASGRWW